MHNRLIKKAHLLFSMLMLSAVWSLLASVNTAQAQAECNTDDVPMNYSLYAEDFKNGGFETALPYLRWILKCAPDYPSKSDRNFRRYVELFEGLATAAEDAGTKRSFLDSALAVYNGGPEQMSKAGINFELYDWTFNKGRFLQSHAEEMPELQSEVGSVYLEAYNIDHSTLQNYYINFIIFDMVTKDNKADAVDFMDRVEVDFAGNAEVMTTIETWRGQLFTSPLERMAFLESQIVKNPNDGELKAELLQLYMDEKMRDRAYEMAETVMKTSPTSRLYRTIAKMRLDDGDTADAIKLYESSMALPGGSEAAKEVYFNIGIAHQQEGRLANARTQFKLSLKADPTFTQALIAIGDLYVTAVQGCGSFEREDRAVYWLAADYFDRAASSSNVDAIKNQAKNRVNSIRRFFPSAEDKFFKAWSPGDKYAVDFGCYSWIGESTSVR
ncbi:MAG: hypothetical protein O3B41_03170 [Bacteroidetes bacterium]|nr:hypothetical protein [Bacteroidota bacterium]